MTARITRVVWLLICAIGALAIALWVWRIGGTGDSSSAVRSPSQPGLVRALESSGVEEAGALLPGADEPGRRGARTLENDPTFLSFRWVSSGLAASGTTWRLSGPGAQREVTIPASGGIGELAAGRWRVEPVDAGLHAHTSTVVVQESGLPIIWCWKRSDLSVQVLDRFENPVSNARARWIPSPSVTRRLGGSVKFDVGLQPVAGVSGNDGKIELGGIPNLEFGALYVHADGYEPETRQIHANEELPLLVYLRSSAGKSFAHLMILDMEGAPLSGVIVEKQLQWLGVSDEAGSIQLSDELVLKGSMHFDGAAYRSSITLDSLVWPDAGRRRVHLRVPSRVQCTLALDGVRGEAGTVYCSIRSSLPPSGQATAAVNEVVAINIDERGRGEFFLPGKMEVQLEVLDTWGRSGQAVHTATAAGELVRLSLDPDPPQILVRAMINQSPDSLAVARVMGAIPTEYFVTIRARKDGTISVPNPSQVLMMEVLSGNGAKTVLTRSGSGPWDGELVIEAEPTYDTRFEVYDPRGDPIPGAVVFASPQRSGMKEYPNLHGGWPSSHPGWVRRVPSEMEGFADSSGGCVLALPKGEYKVRARRSRWSVPVGGASDNAHITYVPVPDAEMLTIPARAFVSLRLLDEEQGSPVPYAFLSINGAKLITVEGGLWSGVVEEAGSSRIWICDAAGRSALVAIPANVTDHKVDVFLSRSTGMRLNVVYADGTPFKGELVCNLYNVERHATAFGMGQVRIETSDAGEAFLALPYTRGPLVQATAIEPGDSSKRRLDDFIWEPDREGSLRTIVRSD